MSGIPPAQLLGQTRVAALDHPLRNKPGEPRVVHQATCPKTRHHPYVVQARHLPSQRQRTSCCTWRQRTHTQPVVTEMGIFNAHRQPLTHDIVPPHLAPCMVDMPGFQAIPQLYCALSQCMGGCDRLWVIRRQIPHGTCIPCFLGGRPIHLGCTHNDLMAPMCSKIGAGEETWCIGWVWCAAGGIRGQAQCDTLA